MENKQIDEIISSLDINEEYKIALYSYLKELYASNKEIFDNLTVRIPTMHQGSFILNQAIDFSKRVNDNLTWEIIGDLSKPYYYLTYPNEENYNSLQKLLPTNQQGPSYQGPSYIEQKAALSETKYEFERIQNEISHLFNSLKDAENSIEKIKQENLVLKNTIYDVTANFESKEKIQFIPVEIFLDINDTKIAFEVYATVLDFLSAIDFERNFEFEAVKGSWFKRILAKSKKAITIEQVTDRLKEVEYGIEVNTVLKQQSEIDKNQSEALLNILNSVEKVPNAAIRIGALLVVKVTNKEGSVNVQVRTLSIKELHLLNKKPELLHKPQEILTALTNQISEDGNGQIPLN